jgi:putative ABC transport system ATP-binding protein
VLEDVSLVVGRGEIVSVVGGRDEGKSTLVEVAAGIESPDRGSVLIEGVEIGGLGDRELSELLRWKVGFAGRVGPTMQMRVGDYVGLSILAGHGLRRRERELRVGEALEWLGVGDCSGLAWDELSRWEKVRVELAQAIVRRPVLLLVDDLLDGLGLEKTDRAVELLRDLASRTGCGVLMVVSDIAAAASSDLVYRLARKRLGLMADNRDDGKLRGIWG